MVKHSKMAIKEEAIAANVIFCHCIEIFDDINF